MAQQQSDPLGPLLKRHRTAAGLTQDELAERAGMSARGISDLERGVKQRPHAYTLGRLISALELDERDAARLEAAAGRGRPQETLRLPSTLPLPPTPLLGRAQEVTSLTTLLAEPAVRLVTLTGTGGVGKTRLALEVAPRLGDQFAHGVTFVNLAPVTAPTLVPSIIARALGIAEVADQPLLETLQTVLHSEERLLILDNYEQVVEAALLVAEILAACPRLTVLVTSRVPLHLRGEHVIAVPPLPVPDLDYLPDLASVAQYPAVALFCARAQETRANFRLTVDSAPAVAEICARLDGLPLAIELAAARVRLFSPSALLDRLSGRLDVLTRGARDLPDRQQSLRATIDWSHSLLSREQQTLFDRLAVFVGGRTLEAVEAVCNPDDELDVLAGMESLLDQGLLREREVEGEMRFELLETLQEYARERLAARGEREMLARTHTAYFLGLAEQAYPHLTGPEQGQWARRLEREFDNLRAALRWTLREGGDALLGLRLAAALTRFWEIQAHHHEGRSWLEEALALPLADDLETLTARASALNGAGTLAWRQGDYPHAKVRHEECLALRRALGDKQGMAGSLNNLGTVAYLAGDREQAVTLFAESVALKRELGDTRGIAISLGNLANAVGDLGNYERARTLHEESLALHRELGDTRSIAMTLHNLGEVAHLQGDLTRAAGLYEESLALQRELGDRWGASVTLDNLATVARQLQDYQRATALYSETLHLAQEIGDRLRVADALEELAKMAMARDEARRAARIFGAAAALRETIGASLPPHKYEGIDHSMQAARARLGEVAFRAAWTAGRGLSLAQAVQEAAS